MDVIIILLLIVNLIVMFSIYHDLNKKDGEEERREIIQKVNGNGNIQSVNTVRVDYEELKNIKQSARIKNSTNRH